MTNEKNFTAVKNIQNAWNSACDFCKDEPNNCLVFRKELTPASFKNNVLTVNAVTYAAYLLFKRTRKFQYAVLRAFQTGTDPVQIQVTFPQYDAERTSDTLDTSWYQDAENESLRTRFNEDLAECCRLLEQKVQNNEDFSKDDKYNFSFMTRMDLDMLKPQQMLDILRSAKVIFASSKLNVISVPEVVHYKDPYAVAFCTFCVALKHNKGLNQFVY